MNGAPLRVLHVDLGDRWGGGHRQVLLLARGMQERGLETWVVTRPGSLLARKSREAGLTVLDHPLRAELDPRTTWRLREHLRDVRPHVVHAHESHALLVAGFAARTVRPRPRVVGHRRVVTPIRRNPVSRWKYVRVPDLLIAVSETVKQVLVADGVPAELIRVVHDGIPLDPLPAPGTPVRQRIGAAPDTPVVMTLAAANRAKDHSTLIVAARRLAERRDEFRWVVFGTGPRLDELRAEVERDGLGGRLHYLGFDPEARALLPEADAFALPTRSEGLGTSVLDAMAAGVPVVASAVGGVPEIVRHEESGLLVPPGDPAALAVALGRLLDDRALARRLAAGGRERVREFDIAGTVAGTEAVYRAIVSGTERSPST